MFSKNPAKYLDTILNKKAFANKEKFLKLFDNISRKYKVRYVLMAKGAESKVRVMNKILETFDGSFLYNNNKEILIFSCIFYYLRLQFV